MRALAETRMARKPATQRYKGKLNKQLSPLPEWAHPAIRSKSEIIQDRKREIAERLHLLLKHYGIDPSDREDAIALADILDRFNNGDIGPGACADNDDE